MTMNSHTLSFVPTQLSKQHIVIIRSPEASRGAEGGAHPKPRACQAGAVPRPNPAPLRSGVPGTPHLASRGCCVQPPGSPYGCAEGNLGGRGEGGVPGACERVWGAWGVGDGG